MVNYSPPVQKHALSNSWRKAAQNAIRRQINPNGQGRRAQSRFQIFSTSRPRNAMAKMPWPRQGNAKAMPWQCHGNASTERNLEPNISCQPGAQSAIES